MPRDSPFGNEKLNFDKHLGCHAKEPGDEGVTQ
jgi:hypothetical protein